MAARVVLVTGATRGVGRGIADAFARRGDTLVIVGRSTDAAPNRLGLPGTLEGVAASCAARGARCSRSTPTSRTPRTPSGSSSRSRTCTARPTCS